MSRMTVLDEFTLTGQLPHGPVIDPKLFQEAMKVCPNVEVVSIFRFPGRYVPVIVAYRIVKLKFFGFNSFERP
jgi:hypothetical protein